MVLLCFVLGGGWDLTRMHTKVKKGTHPSECTQNTARKSVVMWYFACVSPVMMWYKKGNETGAVPAWRQHTTKLC